MIDAMTSPHRQMPKALLQAKLGAAQAARAGATMRGIILAAGLAGLTSLSLSFAATAQDYVGRSGMPNTPPMPPARPSTLSAPAAPVPPQAGAPPPGADPMVADFAPDLPQELPPASRARMHRCGREWQKMKASGAAADKTWLSFAHVCLVR